MAIIWHKTVQGVHYEIRSAGATRRLYTDGVFHSQYNPKQCLTGGVWDLLMLPALFFDPAQIKRVLVLGVGGGAVIRLIKTYVAPDRIIGVELSQQHLNLAQRFFRVKGKSVKLVHAEAVDWMKRYTGPPFDMIIDDLFTEDKGEPVRAVGLDKSWFSLICQHLSHHGVVVANTISAQELKQSAYMTNKSVSKQFASAYTLSLPTYENTIVAFFKQNMPKQQLKERILAMPDGPAKNALCKLPFRLRRLSPKIRENI